MLIIYRKSDNAIIDIIDADIVSGLADSLAAVTVPGDVPAQRPAALTDIPGAAEAATLRNSIETALAGMIATLNTAYPGLELSTADTTTEAGAKMIVAGVTWEEANNLNTLYNAIKQPKEVNTNFRVTLIAGIE